MSFERLGWSEFDKKAGLSILYATKELEQGTIGFFFKWMVSKYYLEVAMNNHL
jgi:hypothetical protein